MNAISRKTRDSRMTDVWFYFIKQRIRIIIADNEKFIPDPETTFDLVNSLTNPGFALKTTFDGGETRFFSGASKHTETIDEGDQYIAFPQRDLFR